MEPRAGRVSGGGCGGVEVESVTIGSSASALFWSEPADWLQSVEVSSTFLYSVPSIDIPSSPLFELQLALPGVSSSGISMSIWNFGEYTVEVVAASSAFSSSFAFCISEGSNSSSASVLSIDG